MSKQSLAFKVVRLNSGGPLMTVTEASESGRIRCAWFWNRRARTDPTGWEGPFYGDFEADSVHQVDPATGDVVAVEVDPAAGRIAGRIARAEGRRVGLRELAEAIVAIPVTDDMTVADYRKLVSVRAMALWEATETEIAPVPDDDDEAPES